MILCPIHKDGRVKVARVRIRGNWWIIEYFPDHLYVKGSVGRISYSNCIWYHQVLGVDADRYDKVFGQTGITDVSPRAVRAYIANTLLGGKK